MLDLYTCFVVFNLCACVVFAGNASECTISLTSGTFCMSLSEFKLFSTANDCVNSPFQKIDNWIPASIFVIPGDRFGRALSNGVWHVAVRCPREAEY